MAKAALNMGTMNLVNTFKDNDKNGPRFITNEGKEYPF